MPETFGSYDTPGYSKDHRAFVSKADDFNSTIAVIDVNNPYASHKYALSEAIRIGAITEGGDYVVAIPTARNAHATVLTPIVPVTPRWEAKRIGS